jgi:excisionase family DNA binding protein
MSDRRTPLPPIDPQQRYTIDETCAYLRQSRAKTYQDIKAGRLPIMKDGTRSYVNGRAIISRSTPAA